MFPKILLIAALLAVTACVPTLAARGKKPLRSPADCRREIDELLKRKPEPAILFIGNSYSFGVPAALKQVAAEHGKTLRTGHSTNSGWTLARHAANESTLRKIRTGRYDIVVLQEFSQLPALPAWRRNPAMFPAVRSLAAGARRAGAVPILYQTWGRRDGDRHNWLYFPNDDFTAMTRRLRAGYQRCSVANDGLFIVPAGDFWEREISAGRGDGLFMPDGSHPTAAGNRLTATAFFQTLFR
jgi:hypothetical protein